MVDEAAEVPAPKRKGPLLMIVLMLFVALAAGGGVYFFVGGKTEKSEQESTAAAGSSESKRKEPAQYVRLDPPFVVNFEAKGLMRFLQVSVEVLTRDTATADLIKKHDPMIRNDLIMLLGNQEYTTISTREGKEQLRAAALQAIAKVIGDEGGNPKQVEQLYFTSFVMQ